MVIVTGYDPALEGPQPSVLPLHHTKHTHGDGLEPSTNTLTGCRSVIELSTINNYMMTRDFHFSNRQDLNLHIISLQDRP